MPAHCASNDYGDVEFTIWGVVKYYLHLGEDYFAGYPWQIVTSYTITVGSIIALIILFVMFLIKVRIEERKKKKEAKLHDYYADKLFTILGAADELTAEQMFEMLGKSEEEVRKNDAYYYANMLEEARMYLYEIPYLPNMQILAIALGVRDRFASQLKRRKDVFRTLQMMLMLQITVNEGLLAPYLNHTNSEVRMMARLNYITCSKTNPYRYLLEDLNKEQPLYRPMILDHVFGWMMFQDRMMPNFFNIAMRVENEDSAAYLVREVANWGKDHEKKATKDLFLDERHKVRSAAIEVVKILEDSSAEEKLVESYLSQPEHIRREILDAMLAINSGKYTEFFKEAYEMTPSRETRTVALQCMREYGASGRRLFEIMRHEADDETRRLIDQVDSNILLQQLQEL